MIQHDPEKPPEIQDLNAEKPPHSLVDDSQYVLASTEYSLLFLLTELTNNRNIARCVISSF